MSNSLRPSPAFADRYCETAEDAVALQQRIDFLERELAEERRLTRQREEAAYHHGLGAAAEVKRQNVLLAAMVSQFVDPYATGNLRKP